VTRLVEEILIVASSRHCCDLDRSPFSLSPRQSQEVPPRSMPTRQVAAVFIPSTGRGPRPFRDFFCPLYKVELVFCGIF